MNDEIGRKGFTDIMLAILIGALLVFGALIFFASETNAMTRSIDMVLREYEISMASNEYDALKRSLQTDTLMSGAQSIFVNGIKGVNGYGDGKPYIWYINHTPPVDYLFNGFPKEYRYNPTKDDLKDKLHHYMNSYFEETNDEIKNGEDKPMKLPGIDMIEMKIKELDAGGINLSESPEYGTLEFKKINPITMSGVICSDTEPENINNYMKIINSSVYECSNYLYIPKCYVFGGMCSLTRGDELSKYLKGPYECSDNSCGCPNNQVCIVNDISCSDLFGCPLDNKSKKIEMTSGFGCRNLSGRTEIEFHPGVDLVYSSSSSSEEKPVYSTGNGIWYAKYSGEETGGYGNMLVIAHGCIEDTNSQPRIYFSIYGHLEGFDSMAITNFKVKKGEKIGYMGNSGTSTGTHLHFEFRNESENNLRENEIVNPGPRTNLVNPCDLMRGTICGSCDCKSECCSQSSSYCDNSKCYRYTGDCKVYSGTESCNERE